jgi:hypothetical protein
MVPLFTRIVPAASRETTMVLSCSSPVTVSTPVAAEYVAVIAASDVFNSTPTDLPNVLATARSGRPSPLKSAAATPKLLKLSAKFTGLAKLPSPLPAKTCTPVPKALAMAKSSRPSPL